jgi:hypothetical protein
VSAEDGTIPVYAERCPTCVFWPGNRMRLNEGRLADLVSVNRARGTALVCHKTLDRPRRERVLCHGFFVAYGDSTAAVQIVRRMSADQGAGDPFVFVPLDDDQET